MQRKEHKPKQLLIRHRFDEDTQAADGINFFHLFLLCTQIARRSGACKTEPYLSSCFSFDRLVFAHDVNPLPLRRREESTGPMVLLRRALLPPGPEGTQ